MNTDMALSAHPVRYIVLPKTRREACDGVLRCFGFLHFVDTGDRLYLQDGERRMEVDIRLSQAPNAHPAEHQAEGIEFAFIGYSEDEATDLVQQYLSCYLSGE